MVKFKIINLIFFSVIIAILILSGCIRNQPPPVSGPGDYDFSLVHDGLTRYYKVHVPLGYDKNNPTPVVIHLHGGGGSMEGAYKDGVDNYSDKYGFILLSPAGTGVLPDRLLVWNYGSWLINGVIQNQSNYATKNNIDDIGFLSKMIDEAKSNFNVDGNRIYVTGISQGGVMSYRLACELSDKIAAIAPVAPPVVPMNCAPSRPVPVMHIHGTADPCAPYEGGLSGGCLGSEKELFQSAQEMVNRWLGINRCSSDSAIVYQKGNATCTSYNKCAGNSEVEFCPVIGMGHTYPSGWQYLPANKIGPVSYDISFDQIWEFFKKHPME